MPPLRLLILSDGRPGHFNLSEGIAAAVARCRKTEVLRADVRRGRWPGAVLAALTRSRLPPSTMFRAVHGHPMADLPPCDLVVSAGAETLAASIWTARERGVPNVFYGSLRRFAPRDFSLVLTSYPRNAGRLNHAMAFKPSRLDPDSLPPLTPPGAGNPLTIALVLGGDAGPVRYTDRDWESILALLKDDSPRAPIRWLVANSRRTSAFVGDRLAELARRPVAPIDTFLDVRTAGPGTLPALLARAHAVVCTADSSSMLSESIWARKPTVAIAPSTCPLSEDERSYRDWMAANGWTLQISVDGLQAGMLLAKLQELRPMRANPLDDLAKLLSSRLPLLRAPAAASGSSGLAAHRSA